MLKLHLVQIAATAIAATAKVQATNRIDNKSRQVSNSMSSGHQRQNTFFK